MMNMSDKSSEIKPIPYLYNGKTLTFDAPLVMAIVNITPDSFYDGSKYADVTDVLRDVEEKVAAGADIIDLGAASSRPGAALLTSDEEWERLKDILPAVRKAFPNTVMSVDTYHAKVAARACGVGADMVNDISGGQLDPNMYDTICGLGVPYVLMHMDGNPQNMAQNAPYPDVVGSVKDSFARKIAHLSNKGFGKIILDPGFGFGKSLQNNYALLKSLGSFADMGFPLLVGLSRKSMVNKVIGTNPVTALNGSTVLHTLALLNGAAILRVHDVTEAKQAIALVSYYQNA